MTDLDEIIISDTKGKELKKIKRIQEMKRSAEENNC